jgi:hypothetical protein
MKSIVNKVCQSLILIFFLANIVQTQGQTPELPGWFSQTPLQMSKTQCFETAINALRSVGLTNQTTEKGWSVHGTNYNVRAGISCVSCGNGVHVSVVVAATHGYPEANSLRDRLRDFMLKGVETVLSPGQTPIDLSGTWYDYTSRTGNKGQISEINQNGNRLTFINHVGSSSKGRFLNDMLVIAEDWEGGLKGTISDGGKRIEWGNGSVWQRSKR